MEKDKKNNNSKLERLRGRIEFKFFIFILSLIILSWAYLSGFIYESAFFPYIFYHFFWILLVLALFFLNCRRIKSKSGEKKDD